MLEKLEAMTSVCSVGLDMIAIPGDTPAETIAAIIADEMAIGVINDKTTAVRLIPVPGAKAGDMVDFGGLFGSMPVMEVRNAGASDGLRPLRRPHPRRRSSRCGTDPRFHSSTCATAVSAVPPRRDPHGRDGRGTR